MNVGIQVSGGVEGLGRVDTRLLKTLGFTGVFVACYEDEVRWRADEVAHFMRAARAEGLETYAIPWGYGNTLEPDPSVDSLYVQTHRDTLQIDSRGRRLRKACPNNPRFLEWFSSSMRTLAWLLECRGFVWDEPGFHHARGSWSCRCQYCTRLFQAAFSRELPRELTDEVLEFRRGSILVFVLAAAAAVQSVDRRLRSFVMPSPRLGKEQVFTGNEDLSRLAQCGGVDGLCISVPWQERGWDMEYGIREAKGGPGQIAHDNDKGCALWVAASPHREDRTLDAIRYAARNGADALVLSDYGTLVDSPRFPGMRAELAAVLEEVQRL